MATQSRRVLRQIWHWKSSSVLMRAVVYLDVAIRCAWHTNALDLRLSRHMTVRRDWPKYWIRQ